MFSCEGCCCHFLFTQIGAIVIVAVPYFLLLFLLLRWCLFNPDAGSLVFFIFLSFYGGLVGWCYIHFMWVKPSRHLLLGLQQVDPAPLKDQPAIGVISDPKNVIAIFLL